MTDVATDDTWSGAKYGRGIHRPNRYWMLLIYGYVFNTNQAVKKVGVKKNSYLRKMGQGSIKIPVDCRRNSQESWELVCRVWINGF